MKKIVVIGGGAGTSVVLRGLRDYPVSLCAIVSMMDSGGSTGRLRKQYGVLPPGDIRQSLIALSNAHPDIQQLFIYRYASGDLKGHNIGNILLSTLEKIAPDYMSSLKLAAMLLQVEGEVIPVTTDNVQLCAEYEDGDVIADEHLIDNANHKSVRIKRAYLSPNALATKESLAAIESADYIIVGPGDLYTSLIPGFLVKNITAQIKKSKAKLILITNLMTKRGQTSKYTATDHIKDLERYIGKKADYILINSEEIPADIVTFYKKYREHVVLDDFSSNKNVYRSPLLNEQIFEKAKEDKAKRSLVRHDSKKIGSAIMELIGN